MAGRSKFFVLFFAMSSLAMALHGLPSASADDFGHPNPGYVADSADHWYCYGAVTDSSQRNIIASSMSYLDDTTDMYDAYSATCGNATDIGWISGYTDGARGRARCVTWAFWGVCESYWVLFDPAVILRDTAYCGGVGNNYEVNLIKTIRHELGHTAGLSHSPPMDLCLGQGFADDAMVSGWIPNFLHYLTYNDHHRAHVNAQY